MDIVTYSMQVGIGVVVTALLTFIGVCIKGAWSRSRAITIAVKSLSHDALFRYCRYLTKKESITKDEHENLENLYQAYRLLGMNGTGKKLYEDCVKKPIRT